MTTGTNETRKKKVSWVGEIAPMLLKKQKEHPEHPFMKVLPNYQRMQSHSSYLLPLLRRHEGVLYSDRSLPMPFSEAEKDLLREFIANPCMADVESVEDLKKAIQVAIEVEIATIPPYLAALYSLKDEKGYVHESLTRIIYQEMRHYGLACNLLLAIGGTPQTISEETLKAYPKQLPWGLGDGQPVSIRKLTHGLRDDEDDDVSTLRQIQTFMAIEKPDFMREPRLKNGTYEVDGNCPGKHTPNSIGELYRKIMIALTILYEGKCISFGNEEKQVDNGPKAHVPLFAITSIHLAKEAINIICSEGEGATDAENGLDPYCWESGPAVPAHYFAFAEMNYGHKIVLKYDEAPVDTTLTEEHRPLAGFSYSGDELHIRDLEVYDMRDNPTLESLKNDPDAFKVANNFAQKWYQLLEALQKTFAEDKKYIGDAVMAMKDCRDAAHVTMLTKMSDGSDKVIGPPFEKPQE